jgi:tetratricopeptide (TPR) repeat protein
MVVRRSVWFPLFFFLSGLLFFMLAQGMLRGVERPRIKAEIEVRLPLFVQVTMAGGDRYLAASLASVRALITETIHMAPEEYATLAQVQVDASWLNPAHEDNYYTSAAILPWEGQLDAALLILKRATQARPDDYQPPFYYAFYLFQFKNDALSAGQWAQRAALRLSSPDERLVMENFAARWLDKSQDLGIAVRIVEAMAAQAKRKDFADYLRQRAQRLRDLDMLRQGASRYLSQFGKPPVSVQDLMASGLIKKVPIDPFGFGFAIDNNGVPQLLNSPPR